MALARPTFGMEMWQPLKKVEREATTCRMNWEVRFVLKMKADLPEKPMDMELLERICMETREFCKYLAIRATREIMWQEPTMRRQGSIRRK